MDISAEHNLDETSFKMKLLLVPKFEMKLVFEIIMSEHGCGSFVVLLNVMIKMSPTVHVKKRAVI